MATIHRQTTIWQTLERELPPGLQEVREFLSALSEFDKDIVGELVRERGHGRDDLPVPAMWNLLATSMYLRHPKHSELLGELRRNSDLARLVGLKEIGPNQYHLPSTSALSRFHVKLHKNHLGKMETLFERTVTALARENPEFGEDAALDASDVRTHARPGRKQPDAEEAQKEKAEQEPERDEKETETPSSDPEASWSVKTKTWEDGQGKKRKETKSTFGYKLYAVTDSKMPGVAAIDVKTGKTSDQKMAVPMVDAARANLPEDRMETVSMDKGFDSEDNVRDFHERNLAAVVPVREVPENLDKLPREDREELLVPGGNVVYDRYTGEVFCYECSRNKNEEPERRPMKYAGFDKQRSSHKFRCPLGGCARAQCGSFDSCAASSSGCQGRQIRIPMKVDYRRFAPIYPRSKRWKRIYNGRSGVERVNGYLKDVLKLEGHCLRGMAAIKLRVLIGSITLNIRTLIALRQQKALAEAA